MRHRLFVCLGLLLLAVVWLAPAAAQEVSLTGQVIERTLPNGLKVLMVKRPEAPLINCILAYRVGAVNEPPGITGVSHFPRAHDVQGHLLHGHQARHAPEGPGVRPADRRARGADRGGGVEGQGARRREDRRVEEAGQRPAEQAEGRDDRQRGNLERLPGGRRHRAQRLDRAGDDAVLRHAAEEQDRAVPRPRGRPDGEPGVPRVLLRARRHHGRAPDEREQPGLVLPGAAQRDLLCGEPLPQPGRGLDVRRQPRHEAGDDRLPREVLPARQRDARARGRRRREGRHAARHEVLRPAEVEGAVAARPHRGALLGVPTRRPMARTSRRRTSRSA